MMRLSFSKLPKLVDLYVSNPFVVHALDTCIGLPFVGSIGKGLIFIKNGLCILTSLICLTRRDTKSFPPSHTRSNYTSVCHGGKP